MEQLMYIDDIKLFAKNELELETQIQTVRLYVQHIGSEFSIERCTVIEMKSSKRHMTEGIELPREEKFRTFEENETNKYWGISEADTIKQVVMKEKN